MKSRKTNHEDSESDADDIDVMAYIEQQIGRVRETRDPQMKMREYIDVESTNSDNQAEDEQPDNDLFSQNVKIDIDTDEPEFPKSINISCQVIKLDRKVKSSNTKFNFKRSPIFDSDEENDHDNEEKQDNRKRVKQTLNDYLQSDDSSSENASDDSADIELSDDEERDFEAHKKPKVNYEGMLEDNVVSSDESDDSRDDEQGRNPYKSLMRHVKQHLKVVLIAYNHKTEFKFDDSSDKAKDLEKYHKSGMSLRTLALLISQQNAL